MRGKIVVLAVSLLAGAFIAAGCAAPEDRATGAGVAGPPSDASGLVGTSPPATAGPPLSSTKPPTLKPPSAPPSTPTDDLPTNLIVGTVTVGGDGPCYGMETNDGQLYALYGDKGMRLSRGDTIRVKIEPLRLMIYCGPGQRAAIVSLEKVG